MDEIKRILSSYFIWTDDVDNIFDSNHIPHFCMPSLNRFYDKDFISQCDRYYVESYDKLPYTVCSSLPFGKSTLLSSKYLNGFDPAMELVNDKNRWENRRNKIILANLNCKSRQVFKEKNKNVRVMSSGILKLAEHLNCDPDPNFSVRHGYNWYYSGGTLNAFSFDNNYFLLSASSCTPGILQVTPIIVSEGNCGPSENKKLFLHADNEKQAIFQTVVRNEFVVLRQKNFSTLFAICNDKKLKFRKIHTSFESDDSIVSLALSNVKDGEYCTLSSSHTLKIWSPERKDCEFSHKFEDRHCKESCDRWGYINYFSSSNLIFSTRDCIYYKDKRTNLNIDLKFWHLKPENNCNYISSVTRSNLNDKIIYVGTKHNLYELDLRKSYSKEWVHMMEYAPMYGASCPVIDGSEAVFISSQNLNEVCLIESNNKSMPFILPSPNEMVVNAEINGVCLNPIIKTRCNFSIIGLTCIPFKNKSSKGVYVFRNTSVGDIFYQKVVKDENLNSTLIVESDVDKNVLLSWERWCKKAVENIADKPLEVTDVVNKKKTFMFLQKNKSTKKLLHSIKEKIDKKEEICCGKWSISKKRLLELEDPLAQCLLEEWDIDDEDEWHKKRKHKSNEFIAEEKFTESTGNSKIESWFSHLPDNNQGLSLPSTSKIITKINTKSKF